LRAQACHIALSCEPLVMDGEGNFMARCGVETTTPRLLRDGRPRRTLYDVGASTIRKRMGMVLV